MRISFFKDEAGNYIVKLFAGYYSQEIVVMGGYFRKVMQSKGNIVVGCCDVDLEILTKLGFAIPAISQEKIG